MKKNNYITLRVNENLKSEILEICDKKNISLSKFIYSLIIRYKNE